MLVLSRKINECIIIGEGIKVMIVGISGDKVRLGIEAPRDVPVHREEVVEAIKVNGNRKRQPPKEITAEEIRTNERGELL